MLGREPLGWEEDNRLPTGIPMWSDVMSRVGKRMEQMNWAPGSQGLSKKIPFCRGLFGRSGGQEAQVLVHCPSWELEVLWEVLTVGLSYTPLDPQTSLPSVSLLKLALTFFLFNNTAVNTAWLTPPKMGDGTSLCNCSGIMTMTAKACLATSVGWAPWQGFSFLTLTTITVGGSPTILILDPRKPRLPWEAETQQSASQNAKPRSEGGWIWTQFCLHSGTHL